MRSLSLRCAPAASTVQNGPLPSPKVQGPPSSPPMLLRSHLLSAPSMDTQGHSSGLCSTESCTVFLLSTLPDGPYYLFLYLTDYPLSFSSPCSKGFEVKGLTILLIAFSLAPGICQAPSMGSMRVCSRFEHTARKEDLLAGSEFRTHLVQVCAS